jgi:hypothetical protein
MSSVTRSDKRVVNKIAKMLSIVQLLYISRVIRSTEYSEYSTTGTRSMEYPDCNFTDMCCGLVNRLCSSVCGRYDS